MGVIQTYYYLTIIAVAMVSLTLIFCWYAAWQLRRFRREGRDPLVAWLIAGAVALMFLFILATTAGVLIGFVQHGAQS
jgi:ABC-type glycerol-3-phosphate transport system permease component